MSDHDFIRSRILAALFLQEEKQLVYLERGRKKGGYDVRKYISLLKDAQDYWDELVDDYMVEADSQIPPERLEIERAEYDAFDIPTDFYPFTSSIPSGLPEGNPSIIHNEDPAKMKILVKRYMQENGFHEEDHEAGVQSKSVEDNGHLRRRKDDLVAELDKIIIGIRPDGPWVEEFVKGRLISIPSFLFVPLQVMLKNPPSSAELQSETEARRQLESIYTKCRRVFSNVSDTFKISLSSKLDNLRVSSRDILEEIKELESLLDKGHNVKAFFGIRSNPPTKDTKGLIYGTPVNECLKRVSLYTGDLIFIDIYDHLEDILTPKGRPFIKEGDRVSLSWLEQLQQAAMPIARDYLYLQLTSEKKADGRSYNNEGNIIIPGADFWDEVEAYIKQHESKEWKNPRGNPTEKFKEYLLLKGFVGYKISDDKKRNPMPLTKSTIREKLRNYFQTL